MNVRVLPFLLFMLPVLEHICALIIIKLWAFTFRLQGLCLISINTRSSLFLFFFLHTFSYVRLRKAEPVLTAGQRQQHIACLQTLTFDLLFKDLAGVLCDSIYSDFFCKLKHKLKKKGTKVEKLVFCSEVEPSADPSTEGIMEI